MNAEEIKAMVESARARGLVKGPSNAELMPHAPLPKKADKPIKTGNEALQRLVMRQQERINIIIGRLDALESTLHKRRQIDVGIGEKPAAEVEAICGVVAREMRVTMEALRQRRGTNQVSRARYAAFALVREFTGLSRVQIGAWFGKDQSSVLTGIRYAKANYGDELKRLRPLVVEAYTQLNTRKENAHE